MDEENILIKEEDGSLLLNYKYAKGRVKVVQGIGNYYGGLALVKTNGKFYWGIEDHIGTKVKEISEDLYKQLIKKT